MTDVQRIAAGCTHFLSGHRRRSLGERLQAIAASPLAEFPTDHYGRGGYVTEFESEMAALLGKAAAVFMPSGTMAQQIAARIWSDRAGAGVIAFHPTCHLQLHEQLGYRMLHGLEAELVGEVDRLIRIEELARIEGNVAMVLLELPQREIGGALPAWEDLTAQCDLARRRGWRVHLDGARLWECGPFYARPYAEIAGLFDSVYVSMYKILGGLPGAILAGPKDFVNESRIWMRRHGGNLQQQAANAVSAKLGLDEHLPRISDYVARAADLARALAKLDGVTILPADPPTNMMHLVLPGDHDRLVAAALRVAETERFGLFFGLPENNRLEITIGDASLDVAVDAIVRQFGRVLAEAAS